MFYAASDRGILFHFEQNILVVDFLLLLLLICRYQILLLSQTHSVHFHVVLWLYSFLGKFASEAVERVEYFLH